MARKGSLRDCVSPAFLMDMADVLEDAGVPYLRRVAEEAPEAFADLLAKIASPAMVKAIIADPSDAELGRVLSVTVAGIRRGTPAEGKPSRRGLH
jgi:hypothetical protein